VRREREATLGLLPHFKAEAKERQEAAALIGGQSGGRGREANSLMPKMAQGYNTGPAREHAARVVGVSC